MVYVATAVATKSVGAAVEGLKALGFVGANVTIPHKEAVLPFLDRLSDAAQAIGAVNTIVRKETASGEAILWGDNTDVTGFLAPLMPFKSQLTGKPMLIFGAGGAIRAVVYGLLTMLKPSRLSLVVRNPEKAAPFMQDMAIYDPTKALHVTTWQELETHLPDAALLVNGTPLGMYPHIDQNVWESKAYHPHQIAYDLIYNPMETSWLKHVKAAGGLAISGLEMFIGQAAAAYRQWTNQEMPLDLVRQTLLDWRMKQEAAP